MNNEMPRHRYTVNNAGSNARGLKFSELREKKKRGWNSKRRHFAVVEGISLFPMFLRKKNQCLKIFRGFTKFLEVIM